MRVTKLLALLMIYLIISLTFSTAIVLATIFKAEAYGEDEISGIIHSDDNLEISTESVMNCSVKADFTNNTYKPMSCSSGTPIICTYTQSVSNATTKISATIMEDISNLTTDVEAYVDNLAPIISSFTTTSLGNMVKASYTLIDKANEYAPGNKCSGIKKVELYLNSQLVNTTNHSVGECSVSDDLRGTLPNYIGKVNTSLIVYDFVDLSANKTGNQVFIDSIPPRISSGAKVYKAGTQEEIKKISTNSSKVWDADVEIEVEDNALAATKSVYGDFSELDKTKSTDQSNVEGRCVRQGWNQTYKCVFSNLKLSPAVGQPSFTITATDQAGNSANQSVRLSFIVINSAGTVTRLGPDPETCYQDKCYLRSGTNKITAEISTSSSFNESNIRIEGTKAECTYNNTWVCKSDVSMTSPKLSLEGFDDLGNPLKAESDLTLVLDSNPPSRVGEINITPICPISSRGQSLQISINVTETQSPEVIIKTNPLTISTDNESIAECVQTRTGLWTCALTISNLKDAPINTNLNIIIEDFAGNQLIQSVPVSICVEVSEIPDLIDKIRTTGTLPRIDRRTASKITVKVPIALEIVKKQEDAEILERSMVDCSDTPGLNGQAYLVNDESLKPILILPLKYDSEWDEDNNIKVNCTQEFMIKHKNKIYTIPEKENITVELEVYNQALGTINDTYQKKIDDMKQELRRLDKKIKKYEGVHKYLGTICNLLEGIARVNQLLQSLKQSIWLLSVALEPIGIGEGLWNAANSILSGFENYVDTFVWPQGWVPTGGNTVGLLLKGTCAIYTCKLYDFNTFVDIGVSIGAYYATRNDNPIVEKREMCDTGTGQCGETYIYADGSTEWAGEPEQSTWFDSQGRQHTFYGSYEDVTLPDGTVETRIFTNDGTGNYYVPMPDGTAQLYDANENPLMTLPIGRDTSDILTNAQANMRSSYYTSSQSSANPNPAQSNNAVVGGSGGTQSVQNPKISQEDFNKLVNDIGNAYNRLKAELRYQWLQLFRPKMSANELEKLRSMPGVGNTVYSLPVTGRVTNPFKNSKLYGTDKKWFDLNTRMQNALDAFLGDEGSWIYNPYKSKHYDKFCAPAILFNDRKERQVLCKRLGCIEQMVEEGGPLEACDFEYNLDMCLYVESARYKIEGPATLGNVLGSIRRVFFSNLLGLGTMITYLFVFPGCVHYQMPGGLVLDFGGTLTGWRAVTCGITGSLLSIREILDFAKNPYNPIKSNAPVNIPDTGLDFCSEVDYSD